MEVRVDSMTSKKLLFFLRILKVAIVFCVLALPFIIGYAVATIGEGNEGKS
jgi:hypothetical protein